jgi:hypothetical protein
MAKLKSGAIEKAAIQQYLKENDDFGFEMHCLRELRKRPLKVNHGGSYSDPITDKTRQFDFRVALGSDERRVALAVECKNLKTNFPLLVSRIPRMRHESFHELLIPNTEQEHFEGLASKAMFNPSETLRVEPPQGIYVPGSMVGKSTVQIGRSPKDELLGDDSEVYERWAQSVASAYGLISDAAHSMDDSDGQKVACFILPVVVVPDGTLWVIDYSVNGEVLREPTTVEETEFYLGHSPWSRGQMFEYTISHLHFLTLTGLSALIDRCTRQREYMERIFPSVLQD